MSGYQTEEFYQAELFLRNSNVVRDVSFGQEMSSNRWYFRIHTKPSWINILTNLGLILIFITILGLCPILSFWHVILGFNCVAIAYLTNRPVREAWIIWNLWKIKPKNTVLWVAFNEEEFQEY